MFYLIHSGLHLFDQFVELVPDYKARVSSRRGVAIKLKALIVTGVTIKGDVMFGKTEDLVIVLVIVMLLFGAKKLPELSRSIGQSVKEVRKGFHGSSDDDEPKKETQT